MNKIYKTAKESLKKDMSAKEGELGCAEAVNAIFKKAIGREVGGDISTYRMYRSLLGDKDFLQVPISSSGDIIISPTGYGVGNGHVGICGENGIIMSNNSFNSLWEENYTLYTWKYKFKAFPIVFFRYKYGEEIIINPIIEATSATTTEKLLKTISELKQTINQLIAFIARLVK